MKNYLYILILLPFFLFNSCLEIFEEYPQCEDGVPVLFEDPCLCGDELAHYGYCCNEVLQEHECGWALGECPDSEDLSIFEDCICGEEIKSSGFCCDKVWRDGECGIIPDCSDGEDIQILAEGCYCSGGLSVNGFCCDDVWQEDICKNVLAYIKEGTRPDWSPVSPMYPEGRLAFDRQTGDYKFYDVYFLDPQIHDPEDIDKPEYYENCLTCDFELPINDRFNERHFGTASWHSSGEFLVVARSKSWDEILEEESLGEQYIREFHDGNDDVFRFCGELSDEEFDSYEFCFSKCEELEYGLEFCESACEKDCMAGFVSFRYRTNPGQGIFNNLYYVNPADGDYEKVLYCDSYFDMGPGDEGRTGLLHPHFSNSGDKIFWSEKLRGAGEMCIPEFEKVCEDLDVSEWDAIEWGKMKLIVADFNFDENGDPCVSNKEEFSPGEQSYFYESHGLSPDNSKVIFSGNLEPLQSVFALDIYSFDIETEELTRLTQTLNDWDEHAHYSPSGEWIAWMSSSEIIDMQEIVYSSGHVAGERYSWQNVLETEVWLMRADGSDKMRLTSFNIEDHPDYMGSSISADISWSPDGTKLAVSIITKSLRLGFTHPIMKIIEFKKPM